MACCHPGLDSIVGSGHGAVAQEAANRGTPCRRGQTGWVWKSAKSPARIGNCIMAPMPRDLGFSAPGRLDPTPWLRPGGKGRRRVRLNEVGRYSARPRWSCRYVSRYFFAYLLLTYHGSNMDVGAYDTLYYVLYVWCGPGLQLLARPETETAVARGRKSRLNGCTMNALETGVGTTRAHTHTHAFFSLFSPGACRADAGGQATRPRAMHAS